MERLDREELYNALIEAGYEDKKERQGIANRFIDRVWRLFNHEATEIRVMAQETIDQRQKTVEALNRFADCAWKIHSILEKGFAGCEEATFQTVRAREAYVLYQSLKRAGMSEENAGYAIYAYLVGKAAEDEIGEPKPAPSLDELKNEIDKIKPEVRKGIDFSNINHKRHR